VPIICHHIHYNENMDERKIKYLVPESLSFAQFQYVIRKNEKLTSHDALYFYVNKKIIPCSSTLIGQLYEKYKGNHGFLYIIYANENTFG
jgi:GABA(A) receptor-associated protein